MLHTPYVKANGNGKGLRLKKKKDEEKNQSQQKLGDIPAVKRVSSGTYVEK